MTEKPAPPPSRHAARHAAAARDFRALAVPFTRRGGHRREALLGVNSAGEWALYDIPATGRVKTGKVVQALADERDRVLQALALQADYTATQDAYQAGRREDDPLPRFSRRSLSRIAEQAERAVALSLAQALAEKDSDLIDRLLALSGEQLTDAAKAA